ncbi:glutathione S-transferase family protein [Sphingomonas crusticola]|uniref:glutathione S-transferase family protein n=1 Tax=Sphingomonas crusticola TaxID=1697973 RepID=UPI001967E62B|nr:glutathione S-transferase family protein [Sphingomonas crusticola]
MSDPIPVITAFRWVPDFAKGQVRDLRVRWALEEVGQPYHVRLVDGASVKAAEHRCLQPFGQVPTYEQDGFTLFESGAILMHIARTRKGLLPADPAAAAAAEQWVFAAMTSVEPAVQDLALVDVFEADKPWKEARRPLSVQRVRDRLEDLSRRLGDKPYLEGEFTAGDLMMACVLRGTARSGLLADYPNLDAYLARCQARPAFQRALAAHLADFDETPPIAA